MTDERDDEALDLFVDHCLQQELGGAEPPDFAARVAAASPDRLALAARTLDAAQSAARRRPWLPLVAAALLLAGGIGLWFALFPGERATVSQRAQELLDRFHAVMPRDPVMLRDAPVRADRAALSLPVLHDILALHAAHPDETTFGNRTLEFELYAVELGDADLRRDLERRAAAGDRVAQAQLAVARATLGQDGARADALADLARLLPALPDAAASLVRCLTTTDLTVAEAEPLAAALPRPDLQRELQRTAALADAGPRRLVDQPLELFGPLVDDRLFSTTALRGRVVLVYFWASWCRPSQALRENLRRVQAAHPEVAIATVSCDHDATALTNLLARTADPGWVTFFDRARPGWHEFALACGVRALPFVMLLDPAGVVREVHCEGDLEGAVRRQLAR